MNADHDDDPQGPSDETPPSTASRTETIAVQPSPAPPWRLRIWHFFLWSALAAVLLTVRTSYSFGDGEEDGYVSQLYQVLAWFAAINAVAIALCVEGVVRRVRFGRPFPSDPGEGLIVLLALSGVVQEIDLLLQWIMSGPGSLHVCWLVSQAVRILGGGATAVLCGAWAWRRFRGSGWSSGFVLLAVIPFAHFLARVVLGPWLTPSVGWVACYSGISIVASLASVVTVAHCLGVDRRRRSRRSWPHWAGVACWIATHLATTAMLLWYIATCEP